jgi:hypothetical protein
MAQIKHRNHGTVAVAIVLLLIVMLGVLSIVRHFWVSSTNDYFDKLISIYIMEKEEFNPEDREKLKAQLLESGLFIKIHRWNRDSFIKNRKLYKDMIITRDNRQMRIREQQGSVVETLINL